MQTKRCSAPDCNAFYAPKAPHQMYCSVRCQRRTLRRETCKCRVADGLCPQCGGPMDYPVGVSPKHSRITYCSRCRDYWRDHWRAKQTQE